MNELQETAVDKRARIYRALAGIIPGGSIIAQLGIEKIPNQRLDRIIAFLEDLESRLKQLESNTFTRDERFGYLAENAILEAAKSYSVERRSWLASICTPLRDPPTDEEWDLRINAVSILGAMSDAEVKHLLDYTDRQKRQERSYGRDAHGYISISLADRQRLPHQELFDRVLFNTESTIHRTGLLKLGLLRENNDGTFRTYDLSAFGELFLFLLTGEMVSKE